LKKLRPIDCERALQRIFEFVDHELEGEEGEAIQRHLDTCRSCFSRADFERRLKAKLRPLRQAEGDPKARDRIEALLKAL
jgi:anti-sigma factor (TIGR02949 family)